MFPLIVYMMGALIVAVRATRLETAHFVCMVLLAHARNVVLCAKMTGVDTAYALSALMDVYANEVLANASCSTKELMVNWEALLLKTFPDIKIENSSYILNGVRWHSILWGAMHPTKDDYKLVKRAFKKSAEFDLAEAEKKRKEAEKWTK